MNDLAQRIQTLDGKSYGAYKSLRGEWRFPDFTLVIDHVQGDPFAAPSRLRAILPPETAALPADSYRTPSRARGAAACLARAFGEDARRLSTRSGSGHSGRIEMAAPGQEVVAQTALRIAPNGEIEARFRAGLPARGRRIKGDAAHDLLLERIPTLVRSIGHPDLVRHAEVNEDADALRAIVQEEGWVAFVADGARLARRSGIDDRPLEGGVPFRSPDAFRRQVTLPNRGSLSGMTIPAGVTVIVGGGYHGKSTLLRAIERGVRNHRPDDGREYVVTDPDAVKVRAEDGRSVQEVDISALIGTLPGGVDTRTFSTPNASGSTSQAAAISEALEAGARVLLMDEDTTATNLMIRDRRMRALIPDEDEPITPFVDRVREMEISTVLVMGGSGDYLDVADQVLAMRDFEARDVTAEARSAVRPATTSLEGPSPRIPLPQPPTKIRVREARRIQMGETTLELDAVDQLVTRRETRAISLALQIALVRLADGKRTLAEILDEVDRLELDDLSDRHPGDLAAFRRHELAAALNRLRTLRVERS